MQKLGYLIASILVLVLLLLQISSNTLRNNDTGKRASSEKAAIEINAIKMQMDDSKPVPKSKPSSPEYSYHERKKNSSGANDNSLGSGTNKGSKAETQQKKKKGNIPEVYLTYENVNPITVASLYNHVLVAIDTKRGRIICGIDMNLRILFEMQPDELQNFSTRGMSAGEITDYAYYVGLVSRDYQIPDADLQLAFMTPHDFQNTLNKKASNFLKEKQISIETIDHLFGKYYQTQKGDINITITGAKKIKGV